VIEKYLKPTTPKTLRKVELSLLLLLIGGFLLLVFGGKAYLTRKQGITNMLALPISKMLYIYPLYMDILFIPSLNGQVP
jgi:hypothetical protein